MGLVTYVVRVKREGCPPGRPFFDPNKRLCVQNCNEGMYPDKDRHRCARCPATASARGGPDTSA